ncbi:hypothetical protein DFH11DRAFT_970948 [Phellopilus nigrolimitatus]|nr:hypothetical protein DFH11DRAFT_970948 [Phellopilus nigrolimitatus]
MHIRGQAGQLFFSFLIAYIWFAFNVVLGTLAAGILISLLVGADIELGFSVKTEYDNYIRATYAQIPLWAASSCYVVWLALYVFLKMARLSKTDKSLVLFAIPSYSCLTIVVVAFMVIYSPAGFAGGGTASNLTLRRTNLANDIISNFFMTAAVFALLGLGIRPASWNSQALNVGAVPVSTPSLSSFQSIKFESPAKLICQCRNAKHVLCPVQRCSETSLTRTRRKIWPCSLITTLFVAFRSLSRILKSFG